MDKDGYLCYKRSRRRVHRVLVEQAYGIKLQRWQQVHHINGNKLDNRLENLRIFLEPNSSSQHYKMHKSQERKYGNWQGIRYCSVCGFIIKPDFLFCQGCGLNIGKNPDKFLKYRP
jgi:hypothetical protein